MILEEPACVILKAAYGALSRISEACMEPQAEVGAIDNSNRAYNATCKKKRGYDLGFSFGDRMRELEGRPQAKSAQWHATA
jgi:hypothetical protein